MVKARFRAASLFLIIFAGLSVYFAGWALSSPVGSSADESRHLVSLWCAETGGTPYCDQTGGETLNVRLPRLLAEGLQCMEGRLDDAANCQASIAISEVSEIRYPGYDNYPGGFYDVFRVFVGSDAMKSVLVIRIVNGALFSLLFACAIALARSRRLYFALCVIAVLWSPVSFLIPSVNPSSWSIMGAILLPLFMVILLDAFESRSYCIAVMSGVLAIVSVLMMAASRFDALLAVPLIIVVSVVCWRNSGAGSGVIPRQMQVVLLSSLFVIFWSLTAVFKYLEIFDDPLEGPPRHHQTVLAHNLAAMPQYVLGFLGADPWNVSAQQGMQVPTLSQFASLAVVIAVVAKAWQQHSILSRRLFLSTLILSVVVVLALHQSAMFYMPKLIQPRYFLPMLVGLIVAFIATSRGSSTKRMLRWTLVLTLVGQSLVLYQNFRRYVIGLREVGNDDLGCIACSMEDVGWWWPNLVIPPVGVWAISVLGLATTLGLIHLAQRSKSSDAMAETRPIDEPKVQCQSTPSQIPMSSPSQ